MSAELTLSFLDASWYLKNRDSIDDKILSLETLTIKNNNEYRLLGLESRARENDWLYDVRLFLEDSNIFMEISAHPLSIENDLSLLLVWIRNQTKILIHDDDGEESNW